MKRLFKTASKINAKFVYLGLQLDSPDNVNRSTDADVDSMADKLQEKLKADSKLSLSDLQGKIQEELIVKTKDKGSIGKLRVRDENWDIVSRIGSGDTVTFLRETKTTTDSSGNESSEKSEKRKHIWFKVQYGENPEDIGWVSAEYLTGKIEEDSAEKQEVPIATQDFVQAEEDSIEMPISLGLGPDISSIADSVESEIDLKSKVDNLPMISAEEVDRLVSINDTYRWQDVVELYNVFPRLSEEQQKQVRENIKKYLETKEVEAEKTMVRYYVDYQGLNMFAQKLMGETTAINSEGFFTNRFEQIGSWGWGDDLDNEKGRLSEIENQQNLIGLALVKFAEGTVSTIDEAFDGLKDGKNDTDVDNLKKAYKEFLKDGVYPSKIGQRNTNKDTLKEAGEDVTESWIQTADRLRASGQREQAAQIYESIFRNEAFEKEVENVDRK